MAKHRSVKPRKTRRRRSVALAPRRRHHAPRHHRKRHHSKGAGHGVTWVQALVAGAAIGYVAENVPQVTTMVSKVPGAATFGIPATIGVLALAADKYVKRNKWLRIVGIGGIMVGAYQLGQKKFAVKWVGDDRLPVGDDDDGMISDIEY